MTERPLTKRQREVLGEIGERTLVGLPYGPGSRPFHALVRRGLVAISMSSSGRGYTATLTPLGKEALE